MVKKTSVMFFSLITVFTILFMTFAIAETYKSEITINVGAFHKVYVSILQDIEEFSKISGSYEYPNHDNLIIKNISVNESSIKIGIAVKDASGNTLLNDKYGPFDTGKPILLDLRKDLGITETNSNLSITTNSSTTNITDTTSQNDTSNETITENTATSSEDTITGWVSIFKTPDNKIKLVYPIVLGIFIAFTVFIMIFRRYNKYKKSKAKNEGKEDEKKDSGYEDEDGEKLRVKKYSELISEKEISNAETKLQEAQQEIEKIKSKQQKIREAREKFEKAKQEWEHARDELEQN